MRNFYDMIREQEADRLALIEEGKEYEEIFKRNDRYYGTYYPYIITKSGVCGGECIVKGIDRITNFETTDI